MLASNLDKNTINAIALVASLFTVIGTGVGATWWLSGQFNFVGNEIKQIRQEAILTRNQIEEFQENNYNLAAASEQAFREAMANPGHKVPDPRDPSQIIVVKITENNNEENN